MQLIKLTAGLFLILSTQLVTAQDQAPGVPGDSIASERKSLTRKPEKNKLLRAVAVPSALIGLGIYSALSDDIINRHAIQDERNKHFHNFHTTADNYLRNVPIVVVYGLNMAGVHGKNDFKNRSLILLKTEILVTLLTYTIKAETNERRPDGKDRSSFPSGHASQAFATATFMAKEYGDRGIGYVIGAYTMATAVGTLRVLNNRHWVSDVLAGAGIGILSTNLVYLTHQYRWKNKESRVTFIPSYNSGPAVYLSYRFK